uniref:Uncharacterized protein n=1 Tax=Oryza meridionalis TaxID=40149 RepID=A0A0E0ELW9_9ORYZ
PARSRIPVPGDRLGFRSRIPSLRFVLAPAQPFGGLGIFLQINLRHPTTEPARLDRAAVLRYRRAAEGAIAPAHRNCGTDSVAHSSLAGPARSRIPVPGDRLGFRSRIPSLRFVLAPAQPFGGLGIFLQINLRHVYKCKI